MGKGSAHDSSRDRSNLQQNLARPLANWKRMADFWYSVELGAKRAPKQETIGPNMISWRAIWRKRAQKVVVAESCFEPDIYSWLARTTTKQIVRSDATSNEPASSVRPSESWLNVKINGFIKHHAQLIVQRLEC